MHCGAGSDVLHFQASHQEKHQACRYYENGCSGGSEEKADERENETSQSFIRDLEVFLDGEEGNPDDLDDDLEGAIDLKVGSSVCSVVLTYKDLSSIVNGFPGDPIGLRPFDLCFSRENF